MTTLEEVFLNINEELQTKKHYVMAQGTNSHYDGNTPLINTNHDSSSVD